MTELIRNPQRWLERNTLFWRRWTIVALALFLTIAITYFVTPENLLRTLLVLLGLSIGLVGAQFILRQPQFGLLLIIPANMVVPFMLSTGAQTGIHATVLLLVVLAGLWLYDMTANRRELRLLSSPTIPPLLLLLILAFLAFFVGQLSWFQISSAPLTAQLGGLGIFALSALAFLLAAHQFRDLRWLEWFTWTFLAFAALYLFLRVVPGLFRYSVRFFTWGSTSSQFWNWLFAMAFSQLLFNKKLAPRWRLALGLLLAAAVYAAFIQTFDWRSGWLPPLVSMVVIAALFDWRLGLLMGIGGMLLTPSLLENLIATDEYSYSTRLDAWIILLEIIHVNPILGLGPANYYYYTPLYEIRGYSVRFNSHNQYIDIVAQIGVLGLIAILWFFIAVSRLGWQLRERVPQGFARAYVYGALGGLAGMVASGMLGDWFFPFIYNVGLVGLRSSIMGWLFLGGLVALRQMLQTGQLKATSDAPLS